MKPTTLYLILAAVVVAAGAYWFFFTGSGNDQPITTSTVTNPAQIQFETLVGELQPITFNTAIFSDPRFDALVDITTAISPETPGRLDPLAPFTGGGSLPSEPAAPATATTAPATVGH